MDKTYNIIRRNGYYEAVDNDGNFVTAGDTYKECYDELKEIMIEEARKVVLWANTNIDINDHINTEVNL